MNALTVKGQQETLSHKLQSTGLQVVLERVRLERPLYDAFPLITAEEYAAIPVAIAALQRSLEGAHVDQITATLAMLSFALPRRQTVEDQSAMLDVYERALADIPADILDEAGMEAVKTLKFFPRVVELRELALPEILRRKWMIGVLERLAQRFEMEKREPEQLVGVDDLRALRQRLADRFESKREEGKAA